MTAFKPTMGSAADTVTATDTAVSADTNEKQQPTSRPANPLKASSSAAYKDEIRNLTSANTKLSEDNVQLNQSIQKSREERLDAILNSRLPLEIDPSIIVDEVSSDRMLENGPEDRFKTLVEDIRGSEQRQPIRVRIKYEEEVEDDVHAFLLGETDVVPDGLCFIIQSGRRRRAACIELKRKVRAFVSADTTDRSPLQDDLLERFKENTLREDLNGLEQLLSIAEIANAFPEKKQQEIADLLSVPRDRVSRAKDAKELEKDLFDFVGSEIYTMPLRDIRTVIPKVKRWIEAGRPDLSTKPEKPEKVSATREKGRAILSNGMTITAGRGGSIKISMEDGSKPNQDQIEWILEAIAKGAGRVK